MQDKNDKIVYILGAGASAQALPIVNDLDKDTHLKVIGLPRAMRILATELQSRPKNPQIDAFIEDLFWLAQQSLSFSTIDTFAKHLYLKDKVQLIRLKKTLSIFFVVEQTVNKKFDSRYLVFMTTILQSVIFPKNLKILSWNYDFQLQYASHTYSGPERIRRYAKGTISSGVLLEYYPPSSNLFPPSASNFNSEKLDLIHLNGIAGQLFDGTFNPENVLIDNIANQTIETILEKFDSVKNVEQLMKFNFENSGDAVKYVSDSLKHALNVSNDASILVIIGYSFPFFNREVDHAIFENIINSGKLKKIYFQDPFNNGSYIRNQFSIPNEVEIVWVNRVDNFFIPREL